VSAGFHVLSRGIENTGVHEATPRCHAVATRRFRGRRSDALRQEKPHNSRAFMEVERTGIEPVTSGLQTRPRACCYVP
jgi:hypothetical protein